MSAHRKTLVALGVLSGSLGLGGVLVYLAVPALLPLARWAAPVLIFSAAALVAVALPPADRFMAVLVGLGGYGAELLGVHLRFPFGVSYRYTQELAGHLWGVPVALAGCWLVLLCYVRQMMLAVRLPRAVWVGAAAAWMVAIDLVVDPAATKVMGYWVWNEGGAYYGVPAVNFAWWYVYSLLFMALLGPAKERHAWVENTGLSALVFFTVLLLGRGLWAAGAIGVALCALHAAACVRIRAPADGRSA